MNIVIKPATPFAKRIRLRVTELEKRLSPSIYQATESRMSKAFADGKHLGTMIQAYLMNKDNWDDIYYLYAPLVEEYQRVKDIPELCADLDPVVSVQNEIAISFELGNYIVDFEGAIDCVVRGEDGFYLSDVKTASSARTDDHFMSRYQSVFYTALFSLIRGITEGLTKFEYRVFIKNKKKGRKQKLIRELEIGWCINQLKMILTSYVEKYNEDMD